ncbi:MAG: RIP metalloprotease RseP [Bacteroidales bacterium]|nr:RIP metalloprotease RseP [Bacteroidales bacterium]
MTALIKALQVILALSLLILIHESGHYFFAKLFRIRVDKFFLFFDVGGRKLFSTKTTRWFARLFPKAAAAETEYGIGWLPLGGYCKINGMVDESMDMDALKSEPKPWEFRSHPAWQRLLVMAGGVLFNFIAAILIYTGLLASHGETFIANNDTPLYVNDLSYEMGFRTGDRVLLYDDWHPEDFSTLQSDLARRSVSRVTLLRGADTVVLYIDRSMIGRVLNTPGMFDLALPFVIDSVMAGGPNDGGALLRGDRICALDSQRVEWMQDGRAILSGFKGREVQAQVMRDGSMLDMTLQVDTLGRLGVFTRMPEISRRDYNMLTAVPAGFRFTFNMIGDYVRDLRLVATPSTQAYKSVGSFIAIGQVFPSRWNWLEFVYLLGLLSIMLGVMNLIPIPGLDGGHILFTLYEMVTGRKPSDRFMYIMQIIGMILIFALMFLAFGNDIGRLIK